MRTTGVDSVLILDNGLRNPEYLVLLCSSLEILKKPCTLPESLTLPLHYGCASTVNMARDVTYPLVPVINFLGVFLVLLPFSTRTLRQRWNTGICMYAIYVATMLHVFDIQAGFDSSGKPVELSREVIGATVM